MSYGTRTQSNWCENSAISRPKTTATTLAGTPLELPTQFSSATIRHGIGTALTPVSSPHAAAGVAVAVALGGGAQIDGSSSGQPPDSVNVSPTKKSPSASSTQSKDADGKTELTRNKEGKFWLCLWLLCMFQ